MGGTKGTVTRTSSKRGILCSTSSPFFQEGGGGALASFPLTYLGYVMMNPHQGWDVRDGVGDVGKKAEQEQDGNEKEILCLLFLGKVNGGPVVSSSFRFLSDLTESTWHSCKIE